MTFLRGFPFLETIFTNFTSSKRFKAIILNFSIQERFSLLIGLKKSQLLILVLVFSVSTILGQKEIPESFCISPEDKLLFDKINLLRTDYGKLEIELSKSLSYVAAVHVNDLQNNRPDTSVCNLSSWSDKGEWTACCYNGYVPKPDCMWDKPKELTPYTYRGYELAGYFEDGFTVDSVIQLWAETKAALDMILTEDTYKPKKWVTMGVAMNKEYVSIWFGQRSDRIGELSSLGFWPAFALDVPLILEFIVLDFG